MISDIGICFIDQTISISLEILRGTRVLTTRLIKHTMQILVNTKSFPISYFLIDQNKSILLQQSIYHILYGCYIYRFAPSSTRKKCLYNEPQFLEKIHSLFNKNILLYSESNRTLQYVFSLMSFVETVKYVFIIFFLNLRANVSRFMQSFCFCDLLYVFPELQTLFVLSKI